MTIQDFQRLYQTEDQCVRALFRARFPDPQCPKCLRKNMYSKRKGRGSFVCTCGRHEIHPKSGTIFNNSSVPLRDWFYVLYLFAQSSHGVSSAEIVRQIGCSPVTAWRMGMKIRSLMIQECVLDGQVEVDESLVGGKKYRGRRGRGSNKAVVVGAVQRGGKLRMKVVQSAKAKHLGPFIHEVVDKDAMLITDDWKAYIGIARRRDMIHRHVAHKMYQWVQGPINTQSIEGQWSTLKNNIRGTYKGVSRKHLQSYLDERTFFFNARLEDRFFILLSRV